MLAAIAVANRTRLPEAPLADANGGVVPRKGMAELLGAHRLRLRLAVTVFAWFTVSLVRSLPLPRLDPVRAQPRFASSHEARPCASGR